MTILYSNNKNIIKSSNKQIKSKMVITPNIYDAYNFQNNFSMESKSQKDLFNSIRTIKISVKRSEILQFKKISDMLISRAKKKAKQILDEALENANVEIIRQKVASKVQGYKEGFEEGKSKAFAEVSEEKNKIIENAMLFYKNAEREAKEYISSKEGEIKEVIFSMVSRIIKRQLNDDKILGDIIYECIKNIRDKQPVIIKCSEFNYKFLKEQIDKWKLKSEILGDFHVVISNEVSRGNFLVERNGGIIKYDVEKNIDDLKKIIFG